MAALFAVVGLFLAGSGGVGCVGDTLFVAETSFGTFDHATRITINPQGWVYVVDAKKNAVLIFRSTIESPFVLGGYGWSSVTFDRPTAVATDGLNVYVSDYGNHRIQRFDRYSNLLSSLFTRDTTYAPARFGYPEGVALTNIGDLIILDSENLRIVEFSSDSRFERSFGDLNTSGGKLQNPVKVCVEGDQIIYVLEKDRILEFDFFGNYLRTFATDLSGDIVGGQATASGIAVISRDTLYWYDSDGTWKSQTPMTALIGEHPVRSVQDVAFFENHMYVLTPTRCHIFKMEYLNH